MNKDHRNIIDGAKALGCSFKEVRDGLQIFSPKGAPILKLQTNRTNQTPGKGTIKRIQRAVASEG